MFSIYRCGTPGANDRGMMCWEPGIDSLLRPGRVNLWWPSRDNLLRPGDLTLVGN